MNLQRYIPILVFFFPAISIKYLLLAGYFLWPVMTQMQRHTIYAIRGVCSVRWFRETGVCNLMTPFMHTPDATHYVRAIQTEFGGLEGPLSSTSEVSPVVQGLTEARLSIGDLILLVKSRTLDSRVALAGELTAVASEMKEAVRGLHKLFAQVQGTVDM